MHEAPPTLLSETLDVLNQYSKTPQDIAWIGSPDFGSCTWDEFAPIAGKTTYSPTSGGQSIASDLMIRGKGDWMFLRQSCAEIGGCGDCEWWAYIDLPAQPAHHVPERLVRLGDEGQTLSQINLTAQSALAEAESVLRLVPRG